MAGVLVGKENDWTRPLVQRLTDGRFYKHCVRVGGVLAVACSVDSLCPEHVGCPSGQAVAHKPEHESRIQLYGQEE